MRSTGTLVPSFGKDAVSLHKHGTHQWVGRSAALTVAGELQAALHHLCVRQHRAAKVYFSSSPRTSGYFCARSISAMRVADNRVVSVLALYREQLAPLYAEREVTAIARAVFKERLGWDAAQLELRKPDALSESELLKVYLPISRLRTGEPLQYVLGEVEFHGLRLKVDPSVLIPRPETEELVDLVLGSGARPDRIVDIGTGSGCIALALKKGYPGAEVHGWDASAPALAVAATNGRASGSEVHWRLVDILNDAVEFPEGTDLVISNPPYIPVDEAASMERTVLDHEPHIALFAPADDPLAFYRCIASKSFVALPAGGHLWFEGHWSHSSEVGLTLRSMGFASVEVLHDLSGHPRFIHAVR